MGCLLIGGIVLPTQAAAENWVATWVTGRPASPGRSAVTKRSHHGGHVGPPRHARTWTVGKQAIQDAVNAWTRTPGASDGIIDFAAPCVDPGDPHLLDAKCDRGDHLHPTAAGSALMAAAIDLSLLLRD